MAKAVAPQTLSGTIAVADEHVTILDDKAEVEDDAVFHWLKGHRIWSQGGHGFALVVDPALPQPWRNKALAFKTEDEARAYLMELRPNASTIRVLTAVAGPLPPAQKPVPTGGLPPAPVQLPPSQPAPRTAATKHHPAPAKHPKASEDELLARVAPLLINGQAWVIPVEHAPNPWVGKADPTVLARVNAAQGTAVDFAFLGRYEGGQWTRGYVPIRSATGRVVGASGMTIATGFDIGQWSASDLTDTLGLDQSLADKLKLFTVRDGQRYLSLPPAGQATGKPSVPMTVQPTGNFRGMTKIGVAKVVAETAPVPVLTKTEADKVDEATHSKILSDAAKEWNRRAGKNVPQFAQLPGGWQTVIMSRFFQQGPAFTKQSPGQTFFSQAVAGDWKAAMATFDGYANHGSFGQYRDRLDAEGKLLHAEIPSTPTPTTTPAGAR